MTILTRKWAPWVALALIVALGASLRLYRVQDESAWCDEALSLQHIQEDGLGQFLEAVQKANAPTVPLYFVLEYAWARAISDSVVSIRLLSILIGCLIIPSVYLVGKATCGRLAGVLAALLVAIHPFHIYYSQEIRMYGLAWLCCVWSVYTLVQIVTTSRRGWWLLHGLVNLALLWTHLFDAFLIAAEGLFLVYCYARRRNLAPLFVWSFLQLALVSTLAVWSILTVTHDSITDAMSWVPPLSIRDVSDVLHQYIGCAFYPQGSPWLRMPFGVYRISQYGLVLTFISSYLYLIVRRIWRKQRDAAPCALTEGEAYTLLFFWSIVPMLALALVAVLVEPSFVARYTGYVSIAFCLVVGAAVAKIPNPRAAAAAGVLVSALLGTQAVLNVSQRPLRHGWDVAARCIQSAPGQPVFINDPSAHVSLSYYLGHPIEFLPKHTDIDDWRRILPFLSAQRSPGWMVFVSYAPDSVIRFERHLNERGLLYTKNIVRGSEYPLVVYHIVPKSLPHP